MLFIQALEADHAPLRPRACSEELMSSRELKVGPRQGELPHKALIFRPLEGVRRLLGLLAEVGEVLKLPPPELDRLRGLFYAQPKRSAQLTRPLLKLLRLFRGQGALV